MFFVFQAESSKVRLKKFLTSSRSAFLIPESSGHFNNELAERKFK